MLRPIGAAFTGAALLLAPQAVGARDRQTQADARCLALMSELLAEAKQTGRQGQIFIFGSVYYLGRIEGAGPGDDIDKLMREAAGDLKEVDRKQETDRCASAISAAGARMEAVGRVLAQVGAEESAREKAAQDAAKKKVPETRR